MADGRVAPWGVGLGIRGAWRSVGSDDVSRFPRDRGLAWAVQGSLARTRSVAPSAGGVTSAVSSVRASSPTTSESDGRLGAGSSASAACCGSQRTGVGSPDGAVESAGPSSGSGPSFLTRLLLLAGHGTVAVRVVPRLPRFGDHPLLRRVACVLAVHYTRRRPAVAMVQCARRCAEGTTQCMGRSGGLLLSTFPHCVLPASHCRIKHVFQCRSQKWSVRSLSRLARP